MDRATLPVPSARDWSELPLDVLSFLFAKLGAIDVLMGAGLVCHSWLEAAKVPDVWRSVKMDEHKFVRRSKYSGRLLAMAKVAVDRSDGQLQMFVGQRFVTDDLLMHIAQRSPSLKSLCLKECHDITNEVFIEVMQKSPLVDLQCLELLEIELTKEGLTAILDNCPHLEILDIHDCCEVEINNDEVLKAKCDRIKTFSITVFEWEYDDGYEYNCYDIYDPCYNSRDSDDLWSLKDEDDIESWSTPESI